MAQRLIVLSPHLDDGVLSCGGLVAAVSASCRVEIWTIFSGAPWMARYSALAQWFHGACGSGKGAILAHRRRREDRAACRGLGAGYRHFGWWDAVYRRKLNGEHLYKTCRQEKWQAEDDNLIEGIARHLRRNLQCDDLLLVPLGLGKHVDHQLVRAAAEISGHATLVYYPDLPYQVRFPEELEPQVAEFARYYYVPTAEQVSQWLAAIRCYRTQLAMLEAVSGTLAGMIESLAQSGEMALYERVGCSGLEMVAGREQLQGS